MKKESYWSRFADDFEERNNYVAGVESIQAICTALRDCGVTGDVLELGCGNGTYSKVLSETADTVVATDYSDEMVAACRERLRDWPKIQVEKQNCLDLSTAYPHQHFDAVVMVNLLHIIDAPERALRESQRVLKHGGQLIVISFCAEGLSPEQLEAMFKRYLETYGEPPATSQRLTVAKTQALIEQAGLTVLEAHLVGISAKAVFIRATREPSLS